MGCVEAYPPRLGSRTFYPCILVCLRKREAKTLFCFLMIIKCRPRVLESIPTNTQGFLAHPHIELSQSFVEHHLSRRPKLHPRLNRTIFLVPRVMPWPGKFSAVSVLWQIVSENSSEFAHMVRCRIQGFDWLNFDSLDFSNPSLFKGSQS